MSAYKNVIHDVLTRMSRYQCSTCQSRSHVSQGHMRRQETWAGHIAGRLCAVLDTVAAFHKAKPGTRCHTHWQRPCGEAFTSIFVLCNRVVFVLHRLHNDGSSHCRCFVCIPLVAAYTTCVKPKDCASYTDMISCSHLCCITHAHNRGRRLTPDIVTLSVLFHVAQSHGVVIKGYCCEVSQSINTCEAISCPMLLYMQR